MADIPMSVYVISDSDLRENGGNFSLEGGAVTRVIGIPGASRAVGGNIQPVYVVTEDQIASGQFQAQGGAAVPVTSVIPVADRGVWGGLVARPVLLISGEL